MELSFWIEILDLLNMYYYNQYFYDNNVQQNIENQRKNFRPKLTKTHN